MQTGKIILISAPSGCGKTHIIANLFKHTELNLRFPISTTTREPRDGEEDGVNYFFVSAEEFKRSVESNSYIEYENVYGDIFYGTSREQIEDNHANTILDIDVDANIILQLKKYYGERLLSLLIIPSSLKKLRKKLYNRYCERQSNMNEDEIEEIVENKISIAKFLLSIKDEFDMIVTSQVDSEPPINEVLEIVRLFLSDDSIYFLDNKLQGLDAIGRILHILNEYSKSERQLCASQYIYRGIYSYYRNTDCKSTGHIIQSGLDIRLQQTVKEYDEKDYLLELNRLISDAKKKFPHVYNTCDLNILADIQHNGGATCLIDFSRNILTALWFTCQSDFDKCGYLYCYNIAHDMDNKSLKYIKDENSVHIEDIFDASSSTKHPSVKKAFAYYLWEPSAINRRIIRQDSIFLLGTKTFLTTEHDVQIIMIHGKSKQSIKEALEIYFNISEATLYNDIVGFAIANGKLKPFPINSDRLYNDNML